jgi:dihydrolipoamide dehydrogenase
MLEAKTTAVNGLTKGVELLFRQNKVDYIKGAAWFICSTRLAIAPTEEALAGTPTEVEARNIIIAMGSEVAPLRSTSSRS